MMSTLSQAKPKSSGKTTNISVSSTPAKQKGITMPTYKADLRYTAEGVQQADTFKGTLSKHVTPLAELLTWRRPSKTPLQDAFIDGYLMPRLEALQKQVSKSCEISVDEYGNVLVDLAHDAKGAKPSSTMFTAHIDTVHSSMLKAQSQEVCYDHTKKTLFKDDNECLGADDGTGIYILLQMIGAGVPGLYAFFKDEECGRLGSTAFLKAAEVEKHMLEGIQRVISFDRMNATDIITRQRGGKCASDEFAKELGKQLKVHAKLDYKPSPNGSFTDSATFMDLIPECTNISIGYKNQHTSSETQNILILEALLAALPHVDWDNLPSHRDPLAVEPSPSSNWDIWGYDDDYGTGYYGGGGKIYGKADDKRFDKLEGFCMPDPDIEDMADFIVSHPYLIAQVFMYEGYELDQIKDLIETLFK